MKLLVEKISSFFGSMKSEPKEKIDSWSEDGVDFPPRIRPEDRFLMEVAIRHGIM